MNVSEEKKKRVLDVLEIAINVGSQFQIGRLYGIGEQIARQHEEEEMFGKGNSGVERQLVG